MPFPSYSFIPFIVDSFLFIPVAKITFVASYSAFIVVTLKFFTYLYFFVFYYFYIYFFFLFYSYFI